MDIPDVSGYKLEKAIKLLKDQGIKKVTVKLTAPPRMRAAGYDDNSRTVRQSVLDDGTLELLVCNTDSIKQDC